MSKKDKYDKYGIDVNLNSNVIHLDMLNRIVSKLALEHVVTRKKMLDMTVQEIIDLYIDWRDKK